MKKQKVPEKVHKITFEKPFFEEMREKLISKAEMELKRVHKPKKYESFFLLQQHKLKKAFLRSRRGS